MKLFALFFVFSLVFANISQAEENYFLWCRGPLTIAGLANYSAQFQFKKNPTMAGSQGEKLQEGACAWADRALNTDEPSVLSYPEINLNSVTDDKGVVSQLSLFQRDLSLLIQGLTSSQYKVRVSVHTVGSSFAPPIQNAARSVLLIPIK